MTIQLYTAFIRYVKALNLAIFQRYGVATLLIHILYPVYYNYKFSLLKSKHNVFIANFLIFLLQVELCRSDD